MQLDAAEVDDPRESRRIVDDDFLRRASRRKRERDRAQPVGTLLRRALLIERLALGAVDEALEHDRPIANAVERAVGDREVVLHEVELRELDVSREVRLVRIRDPDLATVDRQDLSGFFLGHLRKKIASLLRATCSTSLPSCRVAHRARHRMRQARLL